MRPPGSINHRYHWLLTPAATHVPRKLPAIIERQLMLSSHPLLYWVGFLRTHLPAVRRGSTCYITGGRQEPAACCYPPYTAKSQDLISPPYHTLCPPATPHMDYSGFSFYPSPDPSSGPTSPQGSATTGRGPGEGSELSQTAIPVRAYNFSNRCRGRWTRLT